jgi:hypothetical protein
MTAFWDIALCNLVEGDRRFRDAYCLHHHCDLRDCTAKCPRRLSYLYSPLWESEISHNVIFMRSKFTTVPWLKRLVVGLSPRRHGFAPGQSMWVLWWTKWHWDRFSSEFFSFPLSVSFSMAIDSHISYGAWKMARWWPQFRDIASIHRYGHVFKSSLPICEVGRTLASSMFGIGIVW